MTACKFLNKALTYLISIIPSSMLISIILIYAKGINFSPFSIASFDFLRYELKYSNNLFGIISALLSKALGVSLVVVWVCIYILILIIPTIVIVNAYRKLEFLMYSKTKSFVVIVMVISLFVCSIYMLHLHDGIFPSFVISMYVAASITCYVLFKLTFYGSLRASDILTLIIGLALTFVGAGEDPRAILYPLIILVYLTIVLSLLTLSKRNLLNSENLLMLCIVSFSLLVLPYVLQYVSRVEISSYIPFVYGAFKLGLGINKPLNLLTFTYYGSIFNLGSTPGILIVILALIFWAIALSPLLLFRRLCNNTYKSQVQVILHRYGAIHCSLLLLLALCLLLYVRLSDDLAIVLVPIEYLQWHKYLIPNTILKLMLMFRTPRFITFVFIVAFMYSLPFSIWATYIKLRYVKKKSALPILLIVAFVVYSLNACLWIYILSDTVLKWSYDYYAIGDQYIIWQRFRILPGRIEKMPYEHVVVNVKPLQSISYLHEYLVLEYPWSVNTELIKTLMKSGFELYENITLSDDLSVLVLKSKTYKHPKILIPILIVQGLYSQSILFNSCKDIIGIQLDSPMTFTDKIYLIKIIRYLYAPLLNDKEALDYAVMNILATKYSIPLSRYTPEIRIGKSFLQPAFADDPHHGIFIEPKNFDYDFTFKLSYGCALISDLNATFTVPNIFMDVIERSKYVIVGIRYLTLGKLNLSLCCHNKCIQFSLSRGTHAETLYLKWAIKRVRSSILQCRFFNLRLRSKGLSAINVLSIIPLDVYRELHDYAKRNVVIIKDINRFCNTIKPFISTMRITLKEYDRIFGKDIQVEIHSIKSNVKSALNNTSQFINYVLMLSLKPYDRIEIRNIGPKVLNDNMYNKTIMIVNVDYALPSILFSLNGNASFDRIAIIISVNRAGITTSERIIIVIALISMYTIIIRLLTSIKKYLKY